VRASRALAAGSPAPAGPAANFRWLVEEFRVSLFAQELGTAEPVSAVRLQRVLEEINQGHAAQPVPVENGGSGAASATPDKARPGQDKAEPAVHLKPATTAKKGAPLKSLGSLDQLFRK